MSRRREFEFTDLPSTQDFLKQKIRTDGPVEGTWWARADQQSQGRGRQARTWLNADGALLASCAFSRAIDANGTVAFAALPLAAALALIDALESVSGESLSGRIFLKWPNDLVTRGEGPSLLKVAGILCESLGGRDFVIGWGVNLNHGPTDFERATSVASALGRAIELPALYRELQTRFETRVEAWRSGGGSAAIAIEANPWLSPFLGQHGTLPDGRRVEALRLGSQGELWVRTLDDRRDEFALSSGEFIC